MPSLEQQFKEASKLIGAHIRSRKGRASRHYPYPMERDIVVLWGMYRAWNDPIIGEVVGNHINTIKALRRKFMDDPSEIFRCPVLHQGIRGNKPLWRCEFCGAELATTEKKAREHVAGHVLSYEAIKLNGVGSSRL